MEGVPRISMMSFPLRKSADSPNFKQKLKVFIRDHYNEDGESYSNEINELESLRAGAIHTSKDFSGCSTLKKYFCQLNFLKSRFPLQEGGLCAVSFSWYDVCSEQVHGWSDVDFEMSCILYNIGALHSELGFADNRQSPEGMKNACTHFQCAAWAFQHLRHNYQKFFTPDVSPDTLSIMTNICLAQAQECILEKSLIDNRKSTITAKVALQIVEYYQLALKTIDQMLKDSSQYSDKVVKAVKKWRKVVDLKVHYYDCLSLLYRGMQAEDENKWGERVTFYKAAVERLTEAIKSAKSLEKTDNVHDTLQFTFDVVQGKVAISEKENEFVYHEKVPELNSIASEIKGVSLVKGIPFKFDDPEIAGPDIFGRLVPMEAHEASSLYSEEKAKVLRNYSSKIEEKNEALDKLLIALQLDQLDLHSSTTKVPQELVDCCAALSVNKDAVKKLSESMSTLSGMYHDVDGNLKEIQQLLKEDEVKEKEYQDIVGKRVPNNVRTELSREVHKYQNAHSVAAETNQTLHETLSKHVANLNILMKPFDEVLKHIPSLQDNDKMDEEAINQMKRLISKVDEMRKQRVMLEQQLRDSIHGDDITKQLVIKQDQDLETVFQEELQKHDKITQILDQNMLAQENIMRALTEANANYAETRKATVELTKKRDKTIEEMLNSYETYDELLAKCNKGIEFYKKLDANVGKLLQRIRGVCKVQEEERETSLKTLMKKAQVHSTQINNPANVNLGGYTHPDMYPPSSSVSTPGPPKLKDYLAMRKGASKIPDTTTNVDTNYPPSQSNTNYSQQSYQQYPQNTQPYYSNQNDTTVQPIPQHDTTEQSYSTTNNKPEIPSVRPAPVGSEDFSKNNTNSACGYGNYSQQTAGGQMDSMSGQGQYAAQPATYPGQYNTSYPNYSPASVPVPNVPVQMNQNQHGQNYPPSAASQSQYYDPSSQAGNPPLPQSQNIPGGNPGIGSQQRNVYYQPPQQQSQTSSPPSSNYPAPMIQQPYQAYASSTGPSYGQSNSSYSYPAYSSGFHSAGIAGSMGVSMTSQSNNGTNSAPHNPVNTVESTSKNVNSINPTPPNPSFGPPTAVAGVPSDAAGNPQQYYSQISQPTYPAGPSVPSPSSYPAGPSPAVPVGQSTPAAYQPSGNTTTATTYTTGTTPSVNGQNQNAVQGSEYVYESFLAKYVKQNQGYTSSTGSTGLSGSNAGYGTQQPYGYAQQTQSYNPQQAQGYNQSGLQPANDSNSLVGQPVFVGYNSFSNAHQSQSQYPSQNPQGGVVNNQQQPQQTYASNISSENATYQNQQYPQQNQQYNPSQAGPGAPTEHYNYAPQQQSSQVHSYSQVAPTESQQSINALHQPPQQTHDAKGNIPMQSNIISQQPKASSNIDLLSGIDLNAPPVEPLTPFVTQRPGPDRNSSPNSLSQPTPPASSGGSMESTHQGSGYIPFQNASESSAINQNQNTTASTTSWTPSSQTIQSASSSVPDLATIISKGSASRRKPSIDHFADAVVLEKFTYEVEKFEKLIDGLNKKSLNGPTNMDLKWKELVDIQNVETLKKSISVARCYPMKNRFPDILPFDQTRVPLPCTKDDYINASYLNDLCSTAIPFIATQAPLPNTYADFWQMIWLHQIELIVCLCSDFDLNGNLYWPLEKGKDLEFGPLKVTLQTKNIKQTYIERTVSITHRELKQTRVLMHLQFTEWTGHVFPVSPGPVVGFVSEVIGYYQQQRNLSHHVVVHCLAGVGKTGVFCVLSSSVYDIVNGTGISDVLQIAGNASVQRKGILNDKEYLRFTYHCVLYYCQDILMKRGILSARTTFDEKPKTGHIRHPSEDFLKDISMKRVIKMETNNDMPDGQNLSGHNSQAGSGSSSVTSSPRHNPNVPANIVPPAPVSPVGGPSPMKSSRLSDVPSSLTNLDASTFCITPKDADPKSVMREAFEQGKGALLEKRKSTTSLEDPLSSLDPLWTMKK